MAVKKPDNLSFEEAMQELEQIVADMENGSLPLDQALKQFERGIKLAKASNQKLQQAEQQVAILMGEDEQAQLQPFDNEA
ncbi:MULTISPECIES: exodeoxyribonuclease VII small subunit [Pseudoalteromonas]|uniref:exodeoxyribonuclease VII small subunit n=1 Tax=Pseudoalteromonas TaxID=53246 RepID=UPI00029AC8FF|nr:MULTISPECIES: exodeoxyribonuclease VII small subunit [Pseudoalteromonas]AUJ70923.1 Exodeoxyribonuclease 7 small subunit [Pseudoalteromonas sp. NC201]MBR8843999.1 exodeoxyribonuclease VII small subunit [Pseudoalteromonas sp. JC3]MCF2825202.1 exodeoxyribonuclease VII small subunit [Pseudoalteromonas sp. OF5H-5]MCF2832316.1 exodeoxyribonuclease VII small subunit [Pseudoalteromonas sp. DL2-H6]MCF2927018.1 exodeoxyribonuclease VII small subunit [Pseudoalteromonas sp. DL2-H1]